MKTLFVLAFTLGLTGCFASAPVQPPSIKEVPVPVPCVDHVPEEPRLEHDALGRAAPLDVLYAAALRDRDNLLLYSGNLRVQVVACSVIPKR